MPGCMISGFIAASTDRIATLCGPRLGVQMHEGNQDGQHDAACDLRLVQEAASRRDGCIEVPALSKFLQIRLLPCLEQHQCDACS